jgi:hypothetical protein
MKWPRIDQMALKMHFPSNLHIFAIFILKQNDKKHDRESKYIFDENLLKGQKSQYS